MLTAVEPIVPSAAPPDPEWIVQTREGPKDTIDSVVVALILAFVFRAFVVEAFIIPTGSMAPTLYGAHATIVCEDCGTEFAYGLWDASDQRQRGSGNIVKAGHRAICPNCDFVNTPLAIHDENRLAESGDRILVLKWPFDIGGRLGPQRWDVVVFKDPSDGVTNFIKRLVGLPEQVIMIVDGDVYFMPSAELSDAARSELERIATLKTQFAAGKAQGRLPNASQSVLDELAGKMRITRKTDLAQGVLWNLVYNHDFPPSGGASGAPAPHQPVWWPKLGGASGWDARQRRVTFSNKSQPGDYMMLAGKPLVASCAYNILESDSARVTPASDLRVRFVLEPKANTGHVRVRLEKLGRVFWAMFNVAGGELQITESPEEPGEGAAPLVALRVIFPWDRPVACSFEHIDYRLVMRMGDLVLETSPEPGRPDYYGPDLKTLLDPRALDRLRRASSSPNGGAAPPRIYAAGGDFVLTHLVVERDDYYFDKTYPVETGAVPWADRAWGVARSPMLLRKGEYFFLGDNSGASKDSRLWDVVGPHLRDRDDYQLGAVPEDQLIGKAFFVYWPSGIRPSWPPGLDRYGIIPNVGRMRWIR